MTDTINVRELEDEAYEVGFKHGEEGTPKSTSYPKMSSILRSYEEGYRDGTAARNRKEVLQTPK